MTWLFVTVYAITRHLICYCFPRMKWRAHFWSSRKTWGRSMFRGRVCTWRQQVNVVDSPCKVSQPQISIVFLLEVLKKLPSLSNMYVIHIASKIRGNLSRLLFLNIWQELTYTNLVSGELSASWVAGPPPGYHEQPWQYQQCGGWVKGQRKGQTQPRSKVVSTITIFEHFTRIDLT